MTLEQQKTLNALRSEIAGTLFFFIDFDLRMFGRISRGTVEAFQKQRVTFPPVFNELVEGGTIDTQNNTQNF